MGTIKTYSFTERDMEDNATQIFKMTLNYIIENNLTIEQIKEKKDKLAVVLREQSWWTKIFVKEDDPLRYVIVEKVS